jgi:hypothetical protein
LLHQRCDEERGAKPVALAEGLIVIAAAALRSELGDREGDGVRPCALAGDIGHVGDELLAFDRINLAPFARAVDEVFGL